MNIGTIQFADILNGEHEFTKDVDSCAMVGISIDFDQTPADDVQETLEEELRGCGFVTNKEAKVKDLLRVGGNVKGDEGRTDWIIVFDRDPGFNPISRLRAPWPVKWVSDYVDNYAGDYVC